ncbi:MAG: ribonuclease HII [Bacteroidales bacterium]|nr:ribonuclease HII [Bacteroidales bacterium]
MLLQCKNRGIIEAGCDEAGRGCLAGPVFAASVILPPDFEDELISDSKKLTERMRYKLRPVIEECAVAWAVGVVTAEEIDKINILNASILAMHRALEQLKTQPEFILVDGNRFKPYGKVPYSCEVKGDGRFLSIAAASILAKTYRDDYMNGIAEEFPQYGWNVNKGYPTKAHRDAIRDFGITPHHRKSFQLLYRQLTLF